MAGNGLTHLVVEEQNILKIMLQGTIRDGNNAATKGNNGVMTCNTKVTAEAALSESLLL